jgi:pyridoxal phosphate enzyme (YggS family)
VTVVTAITEHLAQLQRRIAGAASVAGRDPASVTVVAVSKGHPPSAIAAARAAGLTHFGENYLKEALPKLDAAGRDAVWHFIGRIQSNKTRAIAGHFAWAQTLVDRRIAERLSAQRPFHAPPLAVLLQVQPTDAPGRDGCPADEVPALAACVAGLPRLVLRGLMLVPKAGLPVDALQAEYERIARLAAMLRRQGHGELDTLSLGMSDDLEIAIAAGSTMIRVGTALFGPRPPARSTYGGADG